MNIIIISKAEYILLTYIFNCGLPSTRFFYTKYIDPLNEYEPTVFVSRRYLIISLIHSHK